MRKILIALFLFYSFSVCCLNNDSINLNSTIDGACDISWTPQPIASSLDLTTSQVDLYVTDLTLDHNTTGSSVWTNKISLDFNDTMMHSNNVNNFVFSGLNFLDGVDGGAMPFGINDFYGESTWTVKFLLSYTGIPTLNLVQGTYTAQWTATCAIEAL